MKKITAIIIGIIIIIIGIFVLVSDNDKEEVLIDSETNSNFMERFTIQRSYENGKHTMYGSIAAPTPCHQVRIESRNVDNDVYMDIPLTEGDEPCAQVITNQPFIYSFEAEEDANFIATYNGEDVELSIIELEEGETVDLENFMLKG